MMVSRFGDVISHQFCLRSLCLHLCLFLIKLTNFFLLKDFFKNSDVSIKIYSAIPKVNVDFLKPSFPLHAFLLFFPDHQLAFVLQLSNQLLSLSPGKTSQVAKKDFIAAIKLTFCTNIVLICSSLACISFRCSLRFCW